eukprot:scaffold67359_cov30-Tisochrysis_lutea.AAC.4
MDAKGRGTASPADNAGQTSAQHGTHNRGCGLRTSAWIDVPLPPRATQAHAAGATSAALGAWRGAAPMSVRDSAQRGQVAA